MVHYQNKKDSITEELIIKKCQNESCLIGKWDKEKEVCIITMKKRDVVRIKDKKERIKNDNKNLWIIKSNVEVIKKDLLKLKEINRKIENTKEAIIKGTSEEVVLEINSFKKQMLLIGQFL